MEAPIEIFLCYAHEDATLLAELQKHLIPLKRQRLITSWYDGDIHAGIEWEQAIRTHLGKADIILLLISHHFLASDYYYSKEMTRAMERHHKGEARVIPIVLRSVHFQNLPFSKLQALPTNAVPVVSKKWNDQDEAFSDIVAGIDKVIEEILAFRKIPVVNESSSLRFGQLLPVKLLSWSPDGSRILSLSKHVSVAEDYGISDTDSQSELRLFDASDGRTVFQKWYTDSYDRSKFHKELQNWT
jgi:hypothetical protein